jgi:hypothetical protein
MLLISTRRIVISTDINRYKAYKTLYQRVIRAAKKQHIARKLTENASNP